MARLWIAALSLIAVIGLIEAAPAPHIPGFPDPQGLVNGFANTASQVGAGIATHAHGALNAGLDAGLGLAGRLSGAFSGAFGGGFGTHANAAGTGQASRHTQTYTHTYTVSEPVH